MPQVCDEVNAMIDVIGVFQWYSTDRDDWIRFGGAWSFGTLFAPMSIFPNWPNCNALVLTKCVSGNQYMPPSCISDPV